MSLTHGTENTENDRFRRSFILTACPICGREVEEHRVPLSDLSEDLQGLIKSNAPGVSDATAVCVQCLSLFERAKDHIKENAAIFEEGNHVLSLPLRLDADDRFTGQNITIAFLDSGFYPHPDLTTPTDRILAYHSLTEQDGDTSSLYNPDVLSWHGMMTSVVAAGNGSLSNGFYRGIAPEANLVLIKLAKTGRITEENIEDGLNWVLEHRERYGIRIVNISAGGDYEQSYLEDSLSKTVERCVREGLIVVCAVGNAGHTKDHAVLPPASSPATIAVGGLDDRNSLNRKRRGMYRSSYGPTIDGLQKPEIIAPGIWVPAPILPHTPTAEGAKLLKMLDDAPDNKLHEIIKANAGVDKDLDAALDRPAYLLRQLLAIKLREENVITQYYKYVDGTSFSAPIVSSVIACMLEANPYLKPHQVKYILIKTAERLPFIEVDRQGWGVIVPRKAVEAALSMRPETTD